MERTDLLAMMGSCGCTELTFNQPSPVILSQPSFPQGSRWRGPTPPRLGDRPVFELLKDYFYHRAAAVLDWCYRLEYGESAAELSLSTSGIDRIPWPGVPRRKPPYRMPPEV